jgi:hypothetical protein
MHPTQYPFPVASGGLRSAPSFRSLRGPPFGSVRQPDLGSPPAVFGLGGFGGGMGARIASHGSEADQSQGLVVIRCGLNPAASGVVQLRFPAGLSAGQYWIAADWASFALTPAGLILQCNWTATRALIANEVLSMAYQWAVSQ